MSSWKPVSAAALLVVAGLVGAAVALAVAGGDSTDAVRTVTQLRTTTAATASEPAEAGSLVAVARSVAAGVVGIQATTTEVVPAGPFSLPSTQERVSSGSGFVLDRQGRILTAEHVVEDATKLHVSLPDGRKVHARLLASDPLLDLAVLDVDVAAATLHPLPLGAGELLQPGDRIVAVGNPFALDRSVSAGVVSALSREIVAPNGFSIANTFQTDAAINHGNSGGPLATLDGDVVGVAVQIADSGVDANVGVGFAVLLDEATRHDIAMLKAGHEVAHAWLGAALADIDAILGTSDRVAVSAGVLVTGVVAGGPADAAGIDGGSAIATVDGASYCVGGDIITAVGDQAVTSAAELQSALVARAPGDEIELTLVAADGADRRVQLTLGTQPTTAPKTTTGCS